MEEVILLIYSASLCKICFKQIYFTEIIFSTTTHLFNFLIFCVQRQSFFYKPKICFNRADFHLDLTPQDSCIITSANTKVETGM